MASIGVKVQVDVMVNLVHVQVYVSTFPFHFFKSKVGMQKVRGQVFEVGVSPVGFFIENHQKSVK